VYTIAYRVQYTRTCVHARLPNGHPREDRSREETRVSDKSANKSARIVVRVRLLASCMNGEVAEHADFRVRMSVSVSVSVPWNLSLSQLSQAIGGLRIRTASRRTRLGTPSRTCGVMSPSYRTGHVATQQPLLKPGGLCHLGAIVTGVPVPW